MRFDPERPPWWEVERGDGPCMRRQAELRRLEARARLKRIEKEIQPLRQSVRPSDRLQLECLRAERDVLREELGMLRLVREVA